MEKVGQQQIIIKIPSGKKEGVKNVHSEESVVYL